jgi:prepilin-type N-terminal cleavage/methylation domain-containing protein
MKTKSTSNRSQRGFTLTEALITMSVVGLVLGMSMTTFMFVMRSMYKDTARLETNANLRHFIAQVSQKTLDASEFYIFKNHEALDGSLNIATDVTDFSTPSFGVDIYHGDCMLLITRVNLDTTSAIRRFRVYYRATTDMNQQAEIRYIESKDFGLESTQTSIPALLNQVNLKANPRPAKSALIVASEVIAKQSIGRPRNAQKTQFYPVFSSEHPTISKTNENVSLNIEIINGKSINNLLSSSSFNYTISPRR